jgi:hypothetical protein
MSYPARVTRAPEAGSSAIRTVGVVGALAGVAIAVVLLAQAIGGVDLNLFGTTRVDRSAPVVLQELRDVSTYTAATGEFSAMIDVEDDVSWVPSFVAGERTIFVGVGTVDATVDFGALSRDAVVVAPDGAVTVTLPDPVLERAAVDPARSHVADRDRGLVNRVAGVFSDSPTSERDLYLAAQRRIATAAKSSELRERAERNTTRMLEGLLGTLGYDRIDVVYGDAAPRVVEG